MKTNSQKDVVAIALINSEGMLEEAREYLDKLLAAYVIVAGNAADGYDLDDDERIQAFGHNAAEMVAGFAGLRRYFAEIRSALGIATDDEGAVGDEGMPAQAAKE